MRSRALQNRSGAGAAVALGLLLVISALLGTAFKAEAQTVELLQGHSLGYIDYSWTGTGGSTSMRLTIMNRTERVWIVHIQRGLRLEPGRAGVQSMTVTEEMQVSVHPHDRQSVEVHVSCLDISYRPPSSTDVTWRTTASTQLRDFMSCTNGLVDDAKAGAPPDETMMLEGLRPVVVQFALWKARGATTQQWIDFLTHYQGIAEPQAQQLAQMFDQAFGELVRRCPSV